MTKKENTKNSNENCSTKPLSELELLILEVGELDCEDVDAALGEYFDGELAPSVVNRIDGHIHSCTKCQEGVKLYKEVIDLAATLRVPDFDEEEVEENGSLPSGVQQRLRESLNERLGLKLRVN